MQDYHKIWDEKYRNGKFIYGSEPNHYFKSKLDTLTPSSIFLPGDGEARNGVYAAENGWKVTSADFSETAILKAKEFAKQKHVTINFQHTNLITDEVLENQYGVVAVSFLHLNGKDKEIVHQKLRNSLKTDGYLILECFSNEQLKLNSGGPRKKDALYSIEELISFYNDFEFIESEEVTTQLQEGEGHQGHQGEAHVIRLFARKTEISNE